MTQTSPTPLELLAPAKNADIGIEAIRHGADAVYIGAPAFGARAAAANGVDDIRRLANFAHLFGAKVYVTVNTIVYDDELNAVEQLIRQLCEAGADALIVQDMAIARLDIPPVPLHASTQMDNRTPEKVKTLRELGYEQVVLARELSLEDISEIHHQCSDVRLEAFVHGALCVSYSGQCFVSQYLFDRSANRGECAQVCRMEFDLENGAGEKLLREKHLLSLKDLCQIDCLEQMADAGVRSFKIEGRLKDMGYVKNVTAAYSQQLDDLVSRHPEKYCRASKGKVILRFTPDVAKSFNRGFTHYFLFGKNDDIFAFDTPKAVGKLVGRIREVFTTHLVVDRLRENGDDDGKKQQRIAFANGDGLCCLAADGRLVGFRVNRADGNRLYPLRMPEGLRRGMRLYRNYDKRFEEVLAGESAERTLPVNIIIGYDKQEKKFILTMRAHDKNTFYEPEISNNTVSLTVPFQPELARTPQHENILRQLSKLGNTPLRLEWLEISFKENYFIPSSLLSQWRRDLASLFLSGNTNQLQKSVTSSVVPLQICQVNVGKRLTKTDSEGIFSADADPGEKKRREAGSERWSSALTPIAGNFNIANRLSRGFYEQAGITSLDPAFELQLSSDTPLMTCRHCIRYALGWCYKRQRNNIEKYHQYQADSQNHLDFQNLFLSLRNGTRLALRFDCQRCLMTVHSYNGNISIESNGVLAPKTEKNN